VAVRPISEMHFSRSLARPVPFDLVVMVREGGRFTLINVSTRLKLANADSERRRLTPRPGQRFYRRD
jgi:hypothetical protein